MNRRPNEPATPAHLSLPDSDGLDDILAQAINHHHAGRADEAEALYRTVLGSPGVHAVASFGFGLLCATQHRSLEAIDAYRNAIAMRPDFVDAYVNLGTVVLAFGQTEEAATLYRQAIAISPDSAMAHGNLGKALHDQGRIDDAIVSYRAAIVLRPDDAIVHTNLGAALLDQRAWDDAAVVTRRAIELRPDNAMAHANLGTALLNLGRHDEALVACRHAIALRLEGVAMHASLGGAMLELGALAEAVMLCRGAIALDPALPSAHFNLSHAFKAMNRLEEAEAEAHQAIALCPDSAEYHFHLAHVLLLMGKFQPGWLEYDWRWKLPEFAWIGRVHGTFSQPRWAGEDISGKTILVHTEQGLGDMILFARYLPLLVLKAKSVIVAAHPAMGQLLKSISGITIVSIRDIPLPDFDVHCPLLSLPRAFATRIDSIPAHVPYLNADPRAEALWAARIDRAMTDGNALKVGIVWAGNPATKRDHLRSPGRNSVMPLFSVPGVDFIVLQVGAGRESLQADPLPPHVLDLGQEVEDLADTAAIVSGLDLMISSCTAPLHLAAALGVQTWAMIPFAPYFPWLLDRSDTPWYPGVRLYRQREPGRDWSEVVDRIALDLAALVRAKPVPQRARRDAAMSAQMPVAEVFSSGQQAAAGFNQLASRQGGLVLFNRNDTYIGASLRKYGEFSGEETELFRLIAQPGRTVLDVGANIGAHTVDLSRFVGPSGVVHAFEPQRLVFQLLCANVALNSCMNVFTNQVAVGAIVDTLLVPSLDPGQCHNYGGLSLLDSQPGEPVPLITIDSLGLRDCQFIKLDVEGMETEALHGAVATIERFRPILYVENDRRGRSEELIGLLQSYRYRLYWHLPRLYRANNFRADAENIFGDKVSVNMICIPVEVPQSTLTNLREVTGPTDSVINW
jgi:FkbM family methyltransferase